MIERLIAPRKRPVGSGQVDRLLPIRERRNVGPFVFADIFGPDELPAGVGSDVPTHPHIGLATLTYLLDGAIVHRDSTGVTQRIDPGAVNWMMAGGGIVHSERSPDEARATSTTLAGLQTWVGLPDEQEDGAPWFEHVEASTVPELADRGIRARLVAGSAFGMTSPVKVSSPLFHADVTLDAGASLALPASLGERAVLVIAGEVTVDGTTVPVHHAAVAGDTDAVVEAPSPARVVTLGGEPIGPRYIWWNFVASTKERIDAAKADWQAHRFAAVPNDPERVELPT